MSKVKEDGLRRAGKALKEMTLEEALRSIRDDHSSCDHEEDIRIDVVDEVMKLLRDRGLIDGKPTGDRRIPCSFCFSTELQVVHVSWCALK